MSTPAGQLNLQWASLMVDALVQAGVRRCCLCSGSRSSPLAVAAARHPGLTCMVHYDERGAAFYALGVARASGQPVAWLTTSGSAVANGFPAVVEAAAARVPLILLTADRPPELLDTGANQAIDQVKIFGGYVRWQADLPCPTEEVAPAFVQTTVAQAVHRARATPAGPVHLNCMFREPLLPEPGDIPAHTALTSYTTYSAPLGAVAPAMLDAVAAALGSQSRGLIVAGELRRPEERRAIVRLAAHLGWPLLPDVLSGLRLGSCQAPRAAYVDQHLLATAAAEKLRPEVVLRVGGPVTSKRLQQFLADAAPRSVVRLRDDPARDDPAHQVTLHAQGDVAALASALTIRLPAAGDDDWAARWMRADPVIDAEVDAFLAGRNAVCEPGVARTVSRLLPAGHGLYVASSMPIRDLDMYGAMNGAPLAPVANRGASGIDGTLATAAGVADGLGAPLTAIVGDLACLHDLNSLALVARAARPVTLVVVNNNGGGIFSFLPVARHADLFETLFGTPHGLHFEAAAGMFGLPYDRVETQAGLNAALAAAARAGRSSLIEVLTDRAENVRVHEALQARIRQRLTEG